MGARSVGVPDGDELVHLPWLQSVMGDLRSHLGANFGPLETWLKNPGLIRQAGRMHRSQRWWTEALGKAS